MTLCSRTKKQQTPEQEPPPRAPVPPHPPAADAISSSTIDINTTESPVTAVPVTAGQVCSLRALEYAHVENTESCEVLTVLGPIVFPLKPHHKLRHPQPQRCVAIPPGCYATVVSPVHRSGVEAGSGRGTCAGYPLVCAAGVAPHLLRSPTIAAARTNQREIRFSQPPFPLFPGESLEEGEPTKLRLLKANEALVLTCTRAFTDERSVGTSPSPSCSTSTAGVSAVTCLRQVGDRYHFKGPGVYYPRVEESCGRLVKATILTAMQAAYVRAEEALIEDDGTRRCAGEEWTVRTIGAYFPPPSARLWKVATAIPLHAGTAHYVRAKGDFIDAYTGAQRKAGQQWMVTCETVGAAYVPGHLEEVLQESIQSTKPRHGEYFIIGNPATPGVRAAGGGSGNVRWGARERRVGPQAFHLVMGETFVGRGVHYVYTLAAEEALLVMATEAFTDEDGAQRPVASRWLVMGPRRYIPALSVRVLERRHVIALHQNAGVYVRNTCTGEIKAVHGKPFMLREDEELWEKPVSRYVRRLIAAPRLCIRSQEEPDIIDDWKQSAQSDAAALLTAPSVTFDAAPVSHVSHHDDTECGEDDGENYSGYSACGAGGRRHVPGGEPYVDAYGVKHQPHDISRYAVVRVNVEQNTLVRLHDTNRGSSRVVAGPAAVSLEPYEEVTCVTLSGGRPKQPNRIHTLSLFLGPDYMSDIVEVETLDHARLKLELAYNWDFGGSDMAGALKSAFTLPDFVGEACKALASRVRIAIASTIFEDFHRNSSSVIRQAIFSAGDDGSTEVREDALYFSVSGLRITNVDLQSVEPVDPKTRTALAKSVQLAVEIITKSQENKATHHASLSEQEARGALDLQIVKDRAAAERERVHLLEVVMHNAATEQCNASRVQALAESQAQLVEAQSERDVTPVRCAAHEAGVDAELDVLQRRMDADLAHRKAMNQLQVERAQQLAEIEAAKYESIMAVLGEATVVAMAQAGPELKARMLAALGLQGFLVTDGSSPISLVSMANNIAAPPASDGR